MSENTKTSKAVFGKAVAKNARFTSFTIEKEGWNLYNVSDGSLVRARVLLAGFLMESKLEDLVKELKPGQKPRLRLAFNPRQVISVESPTELRGKPDSKTYTLTELRASIVVEDIDFDTVKEVWNLYKLENGIKVKLRITPTIISKTNKFDSGGMPIYVVDSNIGVKVEFPEHINRLLEEKRKVSKHD